MSTRFYYGQQDYIVQLNLLDDIASGSASTAAFDAFDARYLGSKTADPTLNNKGQALIAGAMYWNSSTQTLKVYNGSTWAAIGAATAASVGLGNVNNTSDANKPVSIAQQAALDLKANLNNLPWANVTGRPTTLAGYGITDGATTSIAWSGITGKPTTLAGYGITDPVWTTATLTNNSQLTNGSGFITSAGNAASATKLATARLINGVAFDGTQDITISGGGGAATSVPWSGVTGKPTTVAGYGITDLYPKTLSQPMQSGRDFANGTLVETSIDYSVSNGAAWYMEIKGNSYGQAIPFNVQVQGYIYADTIINSGGTSYGTNIPGMIALNMSGKLCFWWPRIAYWHGFTVFVSDVTGQGPAANLVTAIYNSGTPSGTKQVSLTLTQAWTQSNLTNNNQLSNGAGYIVNGSGSVTYATNATRLYATGGTYVYGGANPYYMDMQYNASANRWRLSVTPGTPANVEVYYADNAGRVSTPANGNNRVLIVSGVPSSNTTTASIAVTNGNIHIDPVADASGTYLNYYSGTGGVYFGNGATGASAYVTSGGVYYGSGAGLTGMASSLSVNFASYSGSLGTNYISGGAQKPNHVNFGAGRISGNMLIGGTNIGGASGQWLDTLWMSTYSGGDVKGSNLLMLGKQADYLAFVRQDYDSANWGTVREVWHSGHANAPAVNEVPSSLVKRDANGYIFGSYINMVDHGVNGAGSGVTSIICKQGDNYYRSTGAAAVKTFLGLADNSGGAVAYTTPVRDSAAGLNAATYNSYVGDSGYIVYSLNTTAGGSPAQFYIKHNLSGVDIGNARGGLRLYGAATNLTGAPAYTNGSDGWFRSEGACGWYNASYGTGIYSDGGGLVKTYNNCNFQANIFYGSGAGLTGTGSSFTAGNASSISSAVGNTHTWTGVNYFASNKGSGMYLANTNNAGVQAYSSDGSAAFMSFHRSNSYAVNLGLDPDNILRLGGWSAAANLMQIDMSGNLTMLNNVTAYSDERLKTNWQKMPIDFLERWSKVKAGTYDRIDTGETQVGASAQDVQKIMPDATPTQADGMLSMNYGGAALVATVVIADEVLALKAQLKEQAALIKLLMEKLK